MLRPETPDSAAVQSATPCATSALSGPVAAAANTIPTVMAVDPGNTESAYALISATTLRPIEFAKVPNEQLLDRLSGDDYGECAQRVAIEMVASYGMPVGREVFETCVWIGRYRQVVDHFAPWLPVDLTYRRDVKLHHCHTSKAKDSNITQALVDRFAPGQPNHGKGTKSQPGWFYGFKADVWQAYALAVYVADTHPIPTSTVPALGSLPVAGVGTAAALSPSTAEARPADPPPAGRATPTIRSTEALW